MTTPQTFIINDSKNILIIDSVTFSFKFSEARIAGHHSMGPVFELGAAKVVLTEEQARELVEAGVRDSRL